MPKKRIVDAQKSVRQWIENFAGISWVCESEFERFTVFNNLSMTATSYYIHSSRLQTAPLFMEYK